MPEAAFADEVAGGFGIVGAVNETVLLVLFSLMPVKGLLVFVPPHDKELGVVASVKDVLLAVPGYGKPPLLISPYMVGGTPEAFAHTG